MPDDARAKKPTTLVLLPGLDGTDVFFRPLLAALPQSITATVVQYPTAGANEYSDLLTLVRGALSKTSHCYLLGWSFAGPLALMLANAEPEKIRGVILASSFVRAPRRVYAHLRWAAVTPAIWAIRVGKRLPVWLSRGRNDRLRQDKTETWERVSARMIAARVRTLLAVDARALLQSCPCPVLCLAGNKDGIVPHRNVEDMVQVRPSVSVRTIEGHHFAIYTNPSATVEAVVDFMARNINR